MTELGFNKVCDLEDFQDAELAETIRDVFPHEMRHFTPEFPRGAEYRKYWEIAMSVRALRRFGALRPDAVLLGVGAGTETTLFYLTNHAGQVFATDLYLNPNVWGPFSPQFMLVEPEKIAPYAFQVERLVVQHMDGRSLRYPDNTFDGIFSSGSIEHFGSLALIANSAFEMGRVLKPGGVLTLSTEFQISGPSGGMGWDGLALFTRDCLLRYVVAASGLEPVDELDCAVSPATQATRHELSDYIRESDAHLAQQGPYPRAGEIVWSTYPHIVLAHLGYVFTSVHLTLRKTERYPWPANDWARPNAETQAAVEQLRGQALAPTAAATASVADVPQPAPSASAPWRARSGAALNDLAARIEAWNGVRLKGWHEPGPRGLPKALAAGVRAVARVVYLGHAQQAQAQVYAGLQDVAATTNARLDEAERQTAALAARLASVERGLAASGAGESARPRTG